MAPCSDAPWLSAEHPSTLHAPQSHLDLRQGGVCGCRPDSIHPELPVSGLRVGPS